MPDRTAAITRRAVIGASLAACLVPKLAWPAAPFPANASRPIAIGTYGGAGCTGVPEVRGFEAWLGRRMDVVLDFLEKSSWEGMLKEAQWMAGCWQQLPGRRLVVSVPMLVGEGKPTLAEGASGTYDVHFRALADILVKAGYADSIIRIGWEFNGGWYSWTARGNPGDFARYWRRIALAMRDQPGTRFRFDWCPTTVEGPTEEAYPGDDVVDIIGLDIYNQSWPIIADPALRWHYLLDRPTGLRWHQQFAAAHGKTRSFPEWGTGTRPDGHGGGDDPVYIRNMIAWMRTSGPVEYTCYWNYRAGDYDAKLTDNRLPRAAEALRRLLPTV